MKLPPLVLIEWLDAHAGRGWLTHRELEEAAKPLYCRSVGWLIVDREDCKVIVPHFSGEQDGPAMHKGSGDLTIPAQAMVRLTVLQC